MKNSTNSFPYPKWNNRWELSQFNIWENEDFIRIKDFNIEKRILNEIKKDRNIDSDITNIINHLDYDHIDLDSMFNWIDKGIELSKKPYRDSLVRGFELLSALRWVHSYCIDLDEHFSEDLDYYEKSKDEHFEDGQQIIENAVSDINSGYQPDLILPIAFVRFYIISQRHKNSEFNEMFLLNVLNRLEYISVNNIDGLPSPFSDSFDFLIYEYLIEKEYHQYIFFY